MNRGRRNNVYMAEMKKKKKKKQVDLAGLQKRIDKYEMNVDLLVKRVGEVKEHSESTWDWIRDEYELLDNEIDGNNQEINESIVLPLKRKRQRMLEQYKNQFYIMQTELTRLNAIHNREIEKQFEPLLEKNKLKNKNLSTWTKWVKYTILHWFTLGLITVLQPLNYLGFDIVLKRIIPKSLLSFQEYDEE